MYQSVLSNDEYKQMILLALVGEVFTNWWTIKTVQPLLDEGLAVQSDSDGFGYIQVAITEQGRQKLDEYQQAQQKQK